MAKIGSSKFTTLDKLPDALEEILKEFYLETLENRDKAVRAGAEYFKRAIENETPTDTGEMKQLWTISHYQGKSYVGNKKKAKGNVYRMAGKGKNKTGEARTGVPLSNILEYAKNSTHQHFIKRCFDAHEDQIYEVMKKTIENGGK